MKRRLPNLTLLATTLMAGCQVSTLNVDDGVYGNFGPKHVVQIALTMDPEDWTQLRNESRSFISEFTGDDCLSGPFESDYTTFHATIEMDGESLPDVGIRKKGFIGSQSTIKPSLKINLDEFEAGVELFGTDNLTLNNAVQDPSLLHQCLAYAAFRRAGLPASRCNYARVSMNGEDLGIYAHVEPIKRSFLRDHFGNDDGDLYEGTLSDFQEGWVQTFDSKTDETDTSLAGIQALTEALVSGEPLEEAVAPHLDLDQYLSFLAMETITGHWDGYAGNHNNFYLYDNPETDTFVFIPWGMDDALDAESLEHSTYVYAALPYYVLSDDGLAERFEARTLALLDSVWVEEDLLAEIDRMEALLAGEIDMEPYASGIEGVRDYVSGRRAELEAILPGDPGELEDSTFGCLVEIGTLDATFETSWNSLAFNNLTAHGEVDMSLFYDGWEAEFYDTGAGAGYSEGTPLLVLIGEIDPSNGAYVLPYLYFEDVDSVPEGTPLPIGESAAQGAILYTENSMGGEYYNLGYLFGGSVEFDSFEAESGGSVSGTLSTSIYSWEE